MHLLLVTEKCGPEEGQRDGGSRLVNTLHRALGDKLKIMQFGPQADRSATWHFNYPCHSTDRFERRLANADFIAKQVKAVENSFTHVIFIHVSMQFGLVHFPLKEGLDIWTFPMFLTPSYTASGEVVPKRYFEMELLALALSKNILSPSQLEKRQLMDLYFIPEERIHVVPRGVDTRLLSPSVRSLEGAPKFCSVGSIKPQKNTMGLIQLFAIARLRFPGATLKLIGPIQDSAYGGEVKAEIGRLGLQDSVEWVGYVLPQNLGAAIREAHLHLSVSNFETFGRSIFETLASGLPNVAKATGNASAEFLHNLPYARFIDDTNSALEAIEEMLANLPTLSSMALEIGELYDDERLSQLLAAKICSKEFIAISDFDGTLFHKDDSKKTDRSMAAFRCFSKKVICSARPIDDLLKTLAFYQLEVDWIISYSGALVTDGKGKPLWSTPLNSEDVFRLEKLMPDARKIEIANQVLQVATTTEKMPTLFEFHSEIYQGAVFIAHRQASKFRAVNRLLRSIDWYGQVRVFGDGPYDLELITYFDGILVNSHKEIFYV